jgi:hypothetical protein
VSGCTNPDHGGGTADSPEQTPTRLDGGDLAGCGCWAAIVGGVPVFALLTGADWSPLGHSPSVALSLSALVTSCLLCGCVGYALSYAFARARTEWRAVIFGGTGLLFALGALWAAWGWYSSVHLSGQYTVIRGGHCLHLDALVLASLVALGLLGYLGQACARLLRRADEKGGG